MMLFCVTQVVAWGQSATFDTSTPGTLKVKASGDLTNYQIHETITTKVFTSAAVGNVFTGTASNTGVTAGQEYNESTTYYQIGEINFGVKLNTTGKPDDGDYTYYTVYTGFSKQSAYSDYSIQKIYLNDNPSKLYIETNTGTPSDVQNSTPITVYGVDGYSTIYPYVLVKGSYKTYDGYDFDKLSGDDYEIIVLTEANLSTYFTNGTTITPKSGANLYVSILGGAKTGKASPFLWEDDMEIYNATLGDNVAIGDNGTYFGTGGTGESYITTHNENIDQAFAEFLAAKVKKGGYTNVVFEQNGGEIIIDPAISQAILFQDFAGNNTVKSLDLSAVTMTTPENAFAGKDQYGNYYLNNACLENLVLPSKFNTVFTKLSYSNLANLKVVDISKANLNNTQASTFDTANYGNARVAVIDNDNLTEEQLKARYTSTSKVSAVYSKSTSANPSQVNIYIGDNISNVDFAAHASGYANVVLCSNSSNVTSELLTKVSACTGIKNLVIAKMNGISGDPFETFTDASVKRVILPDNTYLPSLKKLSTGCPIYQVYNSSTNKETIVIADAGDLGAIKDYHYYSTDIDNAYWIEVEGNINAADVAFLNGINNDRLNLSRATNTAGDENALRDALHAFDNDNVKYLAWPVFSTDPSNPTYNDIFTSCSNLKAVGQFVGTAGVNGGKLFAYTKEEGAIKYITEMLGEVTKVGGTGNANVAIKHAKISGTLAAVDLFGSGNSAKIDANGHAYFYPAVDEYAFSQSRTMGAMKDSEGNVVEGHTTITDGALNNVNLVSLDLKDATFTHIEDMTLSALNILGASTTTVIIPTDPSVTDLPADFVNVSGINNLKQICIPANIKTIHARAFQAAPVNYIWTTGNDSNVAYDNGQYYKVTETVEEESVTKFVTVKNGEAIPAGATWNAGTATFSPNLKFIGSYAFGASTMIKDIYALGEEAPECCVNAFSTVTCVANNTLPKINGGVTRESYKVGDGYAAILHFPSSVDEKNAKRYTDVTKEFSIAIGERDDKGKLVMYPMQTEMNKAYVDATTGYLWNYQNYGRVIEGGNNFYEITNSLSYETSKTQAGYQTSANTAYVPAKVSTAVFYSGTNKGEDYNKTTYDKDYRGWHQIILTAYANTGTTPEKSHDFSGINDNEWWTICVPFNMTKAELLKVFGTSSEQLGGGQPSKYPMVCEFMGVTRRYGKSITLNFGLDIVQNKGGVKDAPVADNDVVLVAGHPYMIRPALPDNPAPESRLLKYAEGDSNYEKMLDKTDDELKTMVKNQVVVRTKSEGKVTTDNETADKNCPNNYAFVGTFWLYSMPQYSYFLGWNQSLNGGHGGVCYFYQTGAENLAQRTWNPGTAIIVANWNESTGFNTVEKFETAHWLFNATSDFFTDDSFEKKNAPAPTGAKVNNHSTMAFNIMLGDETITGVNTIHNGNKTFTSVSGNVYDLNGRKVKDANEVKSLPKGIYIVNGMKYVVK